MFFIRVLHQLETPPENVKNTIFFRVGLEND